MSNGQLAVVLPVLKEDRTLKQNVRYLFAFLHEETTSPFLRHRFVSQRTHVGCKVLDLPASVPTF
jgi:hypothetical protein